MPSKSEKEPKAKVREERKVQAEEVIEFLKNKGLTKKQSRAVLSRGYSILTKSIESGR